MDIAFAVLLNVVFARAVLVVEIIMIGNNVNRNTRLPQCTRFMEIRDNDDGAKEKAKDDFDLRWEQHT